MSKSIGIIPARYSSSRFPGKPLIEIGGTSMIRRVYDQAVKSNLDEVVIATDDKRIYDHVIEFGGKVVMTSAEHPSGTERCAEAYTKANSNAQIVVNIQGDEPFINPEQINLLIDLFKNEQTEIGTLIKAITDSETLFNPNTPKVIFNENNEAVYFSRQTIPFLRDIDKSLWLDHETFYKHIGIYAYRSDILTEIVKLNEGRIEKMEKLEQLRWIENGYKIKTAITHIETIGIDTPEDLKKVEQLL